MLGTFRGERLRRRGGKVAQGRQQSFDAPLRALVGNRCGRKWWAKHKVQYVTYV